MRPVKIITDSGADLPPMLRQEYSIGLVPLSYIVNGQALPDYSWENESAKDFYDSMRAGATPTTAQVATPVFIEEFTRWTSAGYDVIYIGFSSALSGTLNAAVLARNACLQKSPDAVIYVVDSLCASLGQGLLALAVGRMAQEEGRGAAELAQWAEENKLRVNHWFTVGDLIYLRRGGRISPLASTVGSLLQLKPVLRVDNGGRLVPWSKVRGRNKSIEELFQRCQDHITEAEGQTIAISHSDCAADAHTLEEKIRKELPIGKCIVHNIGPVIGSHTGPETIALFFWGATRD